MIMGQSLYLKSKNTLHERKDNNLGGGLRGVSCLLVADPEALIADIAIR